MYDSGITLEAESSKAYLNDKIRQYEKAVDMWEEIKRWRHEHH